MPGTYISPAESGLYYLQSRYYNPKVGRFLNADALVSTGQGLLGNNMFAYGLNNPTTRVDITGTRPTTVSAGIAGCITLGPFVYGIQLALVTDSLGYSEVQFTYYSPISSSALANTPSADTMLAKTAAYETYTDVLEFSFMGNISVFNAPLAENLHGIGYQVGGTLGAGSAIAVDYNIVPNGSDNPYRGFTISSGIGSNDVHGVMGVTTRLFKSRISVYDIAAAVHNALYRE